MKPTLSRLVAALAACGTFTAAIAQAPADNTPTVQSNANVATTTPDVNSSATKGRAAPAMPFVDEPIASSFTADGADSELAKIVAQALNGEAALKNAKITVASEKGVVLLTGAALDQAQVQRASEVAIARAGDGNVVNVIQPDHVDYKAAQATLASQAVMAAQPTETAEPG